MFVPEASTEFVEMSQVVFPTHSELLSTVRTAATGNCEHIMDEISHGGGTIYSVPLSQDDLSSKTRLVI